MLFITPLRRAVRRHFGFSRTETNGFAVLLLLLLALLAAPLLLRPALPRYHSAQDRRALNQLTAELAAQRPAARRYPPRQSRYPAVPQVALAPFDPNTLDEAGWQARGLPHFLARRLVRYREVIGGFRAKEQVRKAYGLSPEQYARLAPYLQLPETLPARSDQPYTSRYPRRDSARREWPKSRFVSKPRNLQPFDLNVADTTQLMQIRGVGRRLAARLVDYRERLGGFTSPGQAAEIYVLRDAPDLVDSLRKYTFVRAGYQPAPLNVNGGAFEELCQHPYLGKRLARVLVAYRAQHGPFREPADLRQIRIIDDETYQKLLPYLRF
ncbi:ComEA family DNA-binding protein [Hymenobacter sp. B81]|uniref:ComEA family DNA-binding protein n=1 Tax=Hymenobacter sp. B81 TaxID=3344878 RepID=UPI0037DC1893